MGSLRIPLVWDFGASPHAEIPSYGAVLAFELRRAAAGGPYVVALRAQDGANQTYSTVPLPCAKTSSTAEKVRGCATVRGPAVNRRMSG